MANENTVVHIPFMLESAINNMGLRPSETMSFVPTEGYSDMVIRQSCSYSVQGVPFTPLTSGRNPTIFGNHVFPKEEPIDDITGIPIDHEYDKKLYKSIYSDILVENTLSVPKDKKVTLFLLAMSAIYVIVDSWGRVTDYSPLLRRQIAVWKNNNPGVNFKKRDFFGVDLEGVVGDISNYMSGNGSYVNYGDTGEFNDNLTFFNYSGSRASEVVVFLKPKDAFLTSLQFRGEIAHINNNYKMDLKVSKSGGSSVSSNMSGGVTENLSVISKPPEGPITGTSKPGWAVFVKFPGGLTTKVMSNNEGYWACEYPAGPYTSAELDSIQVTQQEASGGNFSFSSSTEPTVNKDYGLPALEPEESNKQLYGAVIKSRGQLNGTRSLATVSRFDFRNKEPRFTISGVNQGFNFGNNGHFELVTSYPGSIVTEQGIELRSYEIYGDVGDSSSVKSNPLDYDLLGSFSAGEELFDRRSVMLSTTWLSESLEGSTNTLKIRYTQDFDFQKNVLATSWSTNAEVLTEKNTLKVRYDKSLWRDYSYWIRTPYEKVLPDNREYRTYVTMKWEVDLSQEYKNILVTDWVQEQTFFTTEVLSTSWEAVAVDPVIIKPFYVQLWDPINYKFDDCISFNVYGDPVKVERYILENNFRFMFSNPSKFELVMFDYNMSPYNNIFLLGLEDPILSENYTDVPTKYAFIGNYTIKGIDRFNSISLDVIGDTNLLNESRSYWIPESLEDYEQSFRLMADGKSRLMTLENVFRNDHHEDVVELDLVIINKNECCFTTDAVGSKCSPY